MFKEVLPYGVVEDFPGEFDIVNDMVGIDKSLIVSIKMLCALEKIDRGSNLYIGVQSFDIDNVETADIFIDGVLKYLPPTSLLFVKMSGGVYDAKIDEISTILKKHHTEQEAIASYMKSLGIKSKTFLDTDYNKTTIVFVSTETALASASDYKSEHAFSGVMPSLLPWVFDGTKLSESSIHFLKGFTESKSALAMTRRMAVVSDSLNLREYKIDKYIASFETTVGSNLITESELQMKTVNDTISRLTEQLRASYARLESLQATISGLLAKQIADKDDKESLLEFFKSNKSLDIVYVAGSEICVDIRSTLNNFDVDMFESMMNNQNSIFYYDESYKGYKPELGRKVLSAIFDSGKVVVKMGSRLVFNFKSGSFYSNSIDNQAGWLKNYMANIHLKYYECFGGNAKILRECMTKQDLIGTMAQAIALTGNLNLSEINNVSNFMSEVFSERNDDKRWFSFEGNDNATLKEVINYLEGGTML